MMQNPVGPLVYLKHLNSDGWYAVWTALIWGAVMAMYEEDPHVLHPSLASSMNEIYRPSFFSSLLKTS
jgi:hypothetical protein